LTQRRAVHELHRQPCRRALPSGFDDVGLAEAEHPHDMRVVDARPEGGLPTVGREVLGGAEGLGVNHLEGHADP
jgi:hypothetical protein